MHTRVLLIVATASVLLFTGCGKQKPPLPLDMRYRQSVVGGGYVQIFKNTTDKPLVVHVTFKRGSGLFAETLREGTIKIPAQGERQVGWMEGVQLQQGDRIVVFHPDYRDGEWSIPKSFDY